MCIIYDNITDIDDCVAVTCAHDGTCVDAVNSYSCTCTAGWQGQHCLSGMSKYLACYEPRLSDFLLQNLEHT